MTPLVKAQLNFLRMAPRKVRLTADLLRGLPVARAEAELLYSHRRAGGALLKLLRSAIANAKNNHRLNPDELYVKEIHVDEGVKMKRWLPRARGAVAGIQKKTSHITLVLGVSDKLKKPKFIIPERPKKKAKEESQKGKKKAVQEKSAEETHVHPEEKTKREAITARPQKEKTSVFQKVFRRKSI